MSLSSTRTPPRPHLLLADGSYDGRAIMTLAHELARDNVARAAARGVVRRCRAALKCALSSAGKTARAQRHCFTRDRETVALPASHAAILAERTAAPMIDSGRRMVAQVAMIDARAAALGVRL